ncbi:hypothetical protein ACJX0J_016761, partial [Zea mays]
MHHHLGTSVFQVNSISHEKLRNKACMHVDMASSFLKLSLVLREPFWCLSTCILAVHVLAVVWKEACFTLNLMFSNS